ncbi:MAG: restriction endonuclease subunit S [Burkholderiales bacterium]|nr:restriction endonuclease subunit S [Burkholderiales bacterium]
MSDELDGLPRGWRTTTLREIAEIVGGVTKDTKKSQGQGFREVPYLRVANVQRGRLDLNELKLIAASEADIQKLSLQPGDLLVNEGGDRDKLGRGWIWQGQLPVCIHQNHVFRARLQSHEIDPIYIAHFANSMAQSYFAEHGSQTTNLASISLTKLGSLPIQLPPPREQTRIVAKLEELLSDLDAGVAELKAAQKKLAQYRQSLLKAAVTGELTAKWRAENASKISGKAENGSKLLQRILTERCARWEAKLLAKFKEQGKTPPKDWRKKYPEPVQPDTAGLPELPQGWVWASVDQLCDSVRNGLSKTPNTEQRGLPIFKINAVRPMAVNFNAIKHIEISESEAADYWVEAGDVLATRYNGSIDLLGVFAMVQDIPQPTLYPDKLIRMKPVTGTELGSWMEACGNMGASRKHLVSRVKTTAGQTGISGDDLKKTPIPLPPTDEQAAALDLLNERLEGVKELSIPTELALKQSTAQRQNILRAAFAGQLVPQDPNDEPASVLLARIRAERAQREAVKKPRSRKPKEAA